MSGLQINTERCIGCGKCVRACSSHALTLKEKKAEVNANCTLCGICLNSCPVEALSIPREAGPEAVSLEQYRDIWVFAEQDQGQLRPVVAELLGKARELADTRGCQLVAVLGMGPEEPKASVSELSPQYEGADAWDLKRQLIAAGADVVLFCQDERLAEPLADIYIGWITGLIRQRKPEIFLFGATAFGRELAPGVAVQMQTGLTADCTVLEMDADSGLLLQTRPAFGGNLMATIACPNHRPQMATVRAGVMKAMTPDPGRSGHVIETFLEEAAGSRVKIREILRTVETDSITDAEILVVVGRGIGSRKNLALMKRFAQLVGGKLGCSRPLVEAGWCEYRQQVGQTGSSVAPKLLFSVGVSGAIQHQAGIGGAETIVAINSDSKAPIFGISHYSVVGDCIEIVKELVRQLEE